MTTAEITDYRHGDGDYTVLLCVIKSMASYEGTVLTHVYRLYPLPAMAFSE